MLEIPYNILIFTSIFSFILYLHAVSYVYVYQGRQREPSVKTNRSLLSTQISRHYVLSGRDQKRVLSYYPSYSNENIK